jgi:hypothetical protein
MLWGFWNPDPPDPAILLLEPPCPNTPARNPRAPPFLLTLITVVGPVSFFDRASNTDFLRAFLMWLPEGVPAGLAKFVDGF